MEEIYFSALHGALGVRKTKLLFVRLTAHDRVPRGTLTSDLFFHCFFLTLATDFVEKEGLLAVSVMKYKRSNGTQTFNTFSSSSRGTFLTNETPWSLS